MIKFWYINLEFEKDFFWNHQYTSQLYNSQKSNHNHSSNLIPGTLERKCATCLFASSRRQSKINHKSGLNGDNSLFIMVTTQKNIHILKSKLQHNSFFRVGSIVQTPWNLSVHISPGTSNLLSCRIQPERVGHWAWLWHTLLLYFAYFIAESGFEIIIIHATCKGSFLHSADRNKLTSIFCNPQYIAGCPYTPPRYPPPLSCFQRLDWDISQFFCSPGLHSKVVLCLLKELEEVTIRQVAPVCILPIFRPRAPNVNANEIMK